MLVLLSIIQEIDKFVLSLKSATYVVTLLYFLIRLRKNHLFTYLHMHYIKIHINIAKTLTYYHITYYIFDIHKLEILK